MEKKAKEATKTAAHATFKPHQLQAKQPPAKTPQRRDSDVAGLAAG